MTLPAAIAEGRVNIAFGSNITDPSPTWTRVDDTDNLVASYSIDRGRQTELDRTDGGRATVAINDVNALFDPTNADSPYFGQINPLTQITLGRWNPVTEEWQTRFRGFISDYDYAWDPSQRVNRLVLSCVDIFEILNSIQMQPDGTFGDPPPPGSERVVFFDNAQVGDGGRVDQVIGNCGFGDPAFYVAFSGNVELYEESYSPGESPLIVIQEAADAEFPFVANVYTDRFGRLVFHGRLAKFDPATIAVGAGDEAWDWHHWDCGDGAAVALTPSTVAQLREFASNRGRGQVINMASATPKNIADADVAGQVIYDSGSIALYGLQSRSLENLLTKVGLLDGSTALEETLKFAKWLVDTHKEPRDRVPTLVIKSIRPDAPGGAKTWDFLSRADISDQVDITIAYPNGLGFTDTPFFIEGMHETNEPLNPDYDLVTMSLDVSPQDYNSDPESRFPTS